MLSQWGSIQSNQRSQQGYKGASRAYTQKVIPAQQFLGDTQASAAVVPQFSMFSPHILKCPCWNQYIVLSLRAHPKLPAC